MRDGVTNVGFEAGAAISKWRVASQTLVILMNHGLLCIKMTDGVMVVGFEAEHRWRIEDSNM